MLQSMYIIVLLTLLALPVHCLDNGLALTPALGFNTWYALFTLRIFSQAQMY